METPPIDRVALAIQNLLAREVQQIDRRAQLAMHAHELRALLKKRFTRKAIIEELKSCDFPVSPALLRDVLRDSPPKNRSNVRREATKTTEVEAPPPPSESQLPP